MKKSDPPFRLKYFVLVITALVCCVPLFADLGKAPIYMWDEATYANNSLDMYLSHDPMVIRMEGQPDLYNTKPPFAIWMQTISLHVFGLNEFAVRFPSALFAALTLLLIMWFSLAVLDSALMAVFAMLTLVCSNGFVTVHVSRSGDLDAILVFWTTLYVLVFLKYLLKPGNTAVYFIWIAIGLTGAFLTKGIAGWFFIPLLAMVAAFNGSFLKLLRCKELYVATAFVLFFSLGYYFLREKLAPGYLSVVVSSELMRFNNAVMSWHVQPFGFYFKNMVRGNFTPFLYLLPFSLPFIFVEKQSLASRCLLFFWMLTLGFFLLISYPADKLEWYDAPLYPLLSLIIGIFAFRSIEMAVRMKQSVMSPVVIQWTGILLTLLFFSFPYYTMLQKVTKTDDLTYAWDHSQTDLFRIQGAFVKWVSEKEPDLHRYTVLTAPPEHPEHLDQLKFYTRVNAIRNYDSIAIVHQTKLLSTGAVVMVCNSRLQDSIKNLWTTTRLTGWKGCELMRLEAPKNGSFTVTAGNSQAQQQ